MSQALDVRLFVPAVHAIHVIVGVGLALKHLIATPATGLVKPQQEGVVLCTGSEVELLRAVACPHDPDREWRGVVR